MKGVFIVIEGTDGSGKGTQAKKLIEYLNAQGKDVASFDFPQYDKPSSYFVKEYLNGKYGSLSDVPPKRASIFYAVDRFAASPNIRKALDEGKIVICNRYVASNMGHQGGRIESAEERKQYFKWNQQLEFEILGIPQPDLNIILHMPAAIAQELVDKKGNRAYVGGNKRDLHEADLDHLKKAEQAYLDMAQLSPDKFTIIECMAEGKLMSIDAVHEKILEKVKPLLQ